MKLQWIPALSLCAAMLVQAIPTNAAFTSDEIAFAIRPVGDTTLSEDGCVHVSAADAENGVTFHFGVFIEAEHAGMNRIGVRLQSDSDMLTFVPDAIVTAKMQISEEERIYTLPDDSQFSTNFQPYCLGKLNSRGDYLPDCFSVDTNLIDAGDLYVYWLYGIGNAEAFLGGQSDLFSFFTFDAALAPGTQPGSYSLEFCADADSPNPEADHLTSLTCDEGTIAQPDYQRTIPTLKGMRIVVDAEETPSLGDVNHDGNINANDATMVLQYAAKRGTGDSHISDAEHENMRALGDVNGDGIVNANDATGILRYAASNGTGTPLTWEEIFG